jgi:hypothetical protein
MIGVWDESTQGLSKNAQRNSLDRHMGKAMRLMLHRSDWYMPPSGRRLLAARCPPG